ncbi:MAG: hypothetical protein QOG71_2759 [Pyrinomonadaceae bacterium]|nr:hypothetical protein [Pyrinomonadaceae bacterium]
MYVAVSLSTFLVLYGACGAAKFSRRGRALNYSKPHSLRV